MFIKSFLYQLKIICLCLCFSHSLVWSIRSQFNSFTVFFQYVTFNYRLLFRSKKQSMIIICIYTNLYFLFLSFGWNSNFQLSRFCLENINFTPKKHQHFSHFIIFFFQLLLVIYYCVLFIFIELCTIYSI